MPSVPNTVSWWSGPGRAIQLAWKVPAAPAARTQGQDLRVVVDFTVAMHHRARDRHNLVAENGAEQVGDVHTEIDECTTAGRRRIRGTTPRPAPSAAGRRDRTRPARR